MKLIIFLSKVNLDMHIQSMKVVDFQNS